MTYYDYKVIPAPRRTKRVRGVHDPAEMFAHTLTEAINEQARDGWEYVRAESLTAETPGSWFRRGAEADQSVLVFRRERETLGPRLAAVPEAAPAESHGPDATAGRREEPARLAERARRTAPRPEPQLGAPGAPPPTPLRPPPRLGPADRS